MRSLLLCILIILLLLISGCRSADELATLTGQAPVPSDTLPAEDSTPTQEVNTPTPIDDHMFDRSRFLLLNSNPYMVNTEVHQQWYSAAEGYVEQCVGEGYTIYNLRRNLAGQFGEEHRTYFMPVDCVGNTKRVYFGGIAGQFGYETTITIDTITRDNSAPLCILIQAHGHYRIEDDTYQDNIRGYGMRAWVNNEPIGEEWTFAPPESDFNPFWTYKILQNGTYRIRIAWIASWASSIPGLDETGQERSVFEWYSFLVGIDQGANGLDIDTHCR